MFVWCEMGLYFFFFTYCRLISFKMQQCFSFMFFCNEILMVSLWPRLLTKLHDLHTKISLVILLMSKFAFNFARACIDFFATLFGTGCPINKCIYSKVHCSKKYLISKKFFTGRSAMNWILCGYYLWKREFMYIAVKAA